MHRLSRQVRLHVSAAEVVAVEAVNGWGGWPAACAGSAFVMVEVCLSGQLDPASRYVVNINQIDQRVRQEILPLLRRGMFAAVPQSWEQLALAARQCLSRRWPPGLTLEHVTLRPSLYFQVQAIGPEDGMLQLSQKFEFSAAHRLHNPVLSDQDNQGLYGKCNNPAGHGHNYEIEVTLSGRPDASGVLMALRELESLVQRYVLDRFDHKHLNEQTEEFAQVIPTVENIAQVIFDLLEKPLDRPPARLAAITVWETPKTWCRYEKNA